MRIINNYASYQLNGLEVLIISDRYKGSPIMYYEVDVLICSKEILNKYRKQIFPRETSKKKKKTKVCVL